VSEDDDYGDDDMPKTDHEMAIYHYSHSRCQIVLGRIEMMLSCRDTGKYMFYTREGIRHLRIGRIVTESDLMLIELFAKYYLVAGALSLDESRKLLDGIDLVPSPFDPFEGEGLCRACRNLNLRRDTFRVGRSRSVSSIMGDLSPDIKYLDEELERKLLYNTASDATRHYKLGDVQSITKRSECSFCRLIADCFLRLSPEEITSYGFESSDDEWCFDGVVWLSLLCELVGDRPTNKLSENRDGTETEDSLNLLGALTPIGRTRIILSILSQDKDPKDSKFQPLFDFLYTEILPFTEGDDACFQVYKWSMPFIDASRPLKWLYACEKHHGEACSAPGNHRNMEVYEDMLLIDLKDECLVSGF
jgi:hypothetical protein